MSTQDVDRRRPLTAKGLADRASLALQAGVSAALTSGNVVKNLSSTKSQVEQILNV